MQQYTPLILSSLYNEIAPNTCEKPNFSFETGNFILNVEFEILKSQFRSNLGPHYRFFVEILLSHTHTCCALCFSPFPQFCQNDTAIYEIIE